MLDLINKHDEQSDDVEKILPLLQQALKESRTENGGLNEKGAEIALWFYNFQDNLLPPRQIAQADQDKVKVPIPFNNMAIRNSSISPSSAIRFRRKKKNRSSLNGSLDSNSSQKDQLIVSNSRNVNKVASKVNTLQ